MAHPKEDASKIGTMSHNWMLIAGCLFGALTLLYLMFLSLMILGAGKRLGCGDSWITSLIFGLGVGLSSAFLGGYVASDGNLKIPILGDNPIAASIKGGIAFLVVGTGIAYLLTSSTCADPRQVFVRPYFNEWHYFVNEKKLAFRLEKDFLEPQRLYIPEGSVGSYDVFVAARAQGENDPWSGSYDLVTGPFGFSTANMIEKPLTDEQISALGSCVQMIAFGLKSGRKPGAPFFPASETELQRFQWAGTCRKDER